MLNQRGFYSVAIVALILAVVGLGGCASSLSANSYSRNQARQLQQVQYGTVQSVAPAPIEGTQSSIGSTSGAAVGGITASSVGGSNRTKAVAGIAGAIAGGLLGGAAEEGLTRQVGQRIIVNLDDGRSIAVVQAADQRFAPGERVLLLTGRDGTARITR